VLAPEPEFVVFVFDRDGEYVEDSRARTGAAGVKLAVETSARVQGLVVAVGQAPTHPAPPDVYRGLLPTGVEHNRSVEARPLTGPYLVPTWWRAPIGARGHLVGSLRRQRPEDPAALPLVLVLWAEQPQEQFDELVEMIDDRLRVRQVSSPARARLYIERLVEAQDLPSYSRRYGGPVPEFDDANYGEALDEWARAVDDLEDRFRVGVIAGFSPSSITRIPQGGSA